VVVENCGHMLEILSWLQDSESGVTVCKIKNRYATGSDVLDGCVRVPVYVSSPFSVCDKMQRISTEKDTDGDGDGDRDSDRDRDRDRDSDSDSDRDRDRDRDRDSDSDRDRDRDRDKAQSQRQKRDILTYTVHVYAQR
jgi:hypothetical protein